MSQPVDYTRGAADVGQQRQMYKSFNTLVHWGSLIVAVLLAFLVLWLCARAGFIPAFIVAAVMAVAGTFWLRRPNTH